LNQDRGQMTSERAFAEHRLLTAAEERRLARRIERGDLAAKDRLVSSNLRLVASVARRYVGRGLPMEDLMQEGVLGLIRAAEKFDWRRRTRFSTYAVPWIRQAITHALANTSRLVRLPAPQHLEADRLARAERGLLEHGREPSAAALAEATGMKEDAVLRVRRADAAVASLDAPVGDGSGKLGDVLSDADATQPVEVALAAERRRAVRRSIERLAGRDREVMRLRYGLDGGGQRTLGAVGTAVGLSPERVRQLEVAALERLHEDDELAGWAEPVAA
jgi:RNA polymerase primary sigma factor